MIFDRYLLHICQFFFICQDRYFDTNAFCVQFLNIFSLPDVASAVMPLVHIVSVVVCVSVTVPEDDEPNKVVLYLYLFLVNLIKHCTDIL